MIGFKYIAIVTLLLGSALLSSATPVPEYSHLVARGNSHSAPRASISIRSCHDCPTQLHDKIIAKVEKEYKKDKQLAQKGYNVCDIQWRSGIITASYSVDGSISQRVTIAYRPSNF